LKVGTGKYKEVSITLWIIDIFAIGAMFLGH
jgi:hypothetical protein